MGAVDRSRLDAWLARFGGPRFRGFDDRDRAVAEMRAAGRDAVFPLLIPLLNDDDLEVRCAAYEAVLWVDPERGVPLVLPLLGDPGEVVRWCVCGCLGQFGDDRAVAPLVAVLRSDGDAQVRGTAALALGRLGGPAVIAVLLAAMANDHEEDIHGHTPSSCAATALDEILGTKLTDKRPDLDRLLGLAEDRYCQWSDGPT